jgi:hypothetical protein
MVSAAQPKVESSRGRAQKSALRSKVEKLVRPVTLPKLMAESDPGEHVPRKGSVDVRKECVVSDFC